MTSGVWLARVGPCRDAPVRLYCIPYCGGSATVFSGWGAGLPDVDVRAAQLPGRGLRRDEPPCRTLAPLVESIAAAIVDSTDRPYALFGHSFGALIGFEVSRAIARGGAPPPLTLFVSGSGAPHLPDPNPWLHTLTDTELIASIARLNGTPRQVLAEPDLMRLLLPMLRADFEAYETYSYAEGPRLECPITAYGGLSDPRVARDRLQGWEAQTTASFSVRMFPGDHFFLESARKDLLDALRADLAASSTALKRIR